MKKLVFLLSAILGLCLSSCSSSDQSGGEDQSAGDSKATPPGLAALQAEGGEIVTNPSGVSYQDLVVGSGNEITNGSHVEFDYGCWLSDPSGVTKTTALESSVGRPGRSFKGEVGVHPLPGLSDGLIGMRVGGTRRVYIPGQLGFKAGTPFDGSNLIFEVVNIREITREEVSHYQDSLARWLDFAKKQSDSIRRALRDSAAARGLDSLGQPLDSAGTSGAAGGQ